jgi:transcriptional regulator with XRE-family HTH domain
MDDLRSMRRSRHLTLKELSARSGVPVPTLKAYETGLRKPSRERLIVLLDALAPDLSVRNEMLSAAGFAPEGRRSPDRSMGLDEAAAEIRSRPWPASVMSETIEMHAANDLLLAVWGFDPARLADPIRRNVLSMVTDQRLAERCVNWEEAVSGIIAVYKRWRGELASLERPTPYLGAILDEVNKGVPSLVRRFVDLWERTPAAPPGKMSWTYPAVWQIPRVGTMRFVCVVNSVNEADSLDIDDWIPADAASHRTLERLFASSRSRQPPLAE